MSAHPSRFRQRQPGAPRPRPGFPPLLALFLGLVAAPAVGRDLLVPDEHPTIQEALDAAEPGDVVRVRPGVYPEIVSMRDSVAVVSAERWQALLIGEVHMHFLHRATFEGFTVMSNYGGIHCFGGEGNVIQKNLVTGGTDAVGPGITCFDGSALIHENIVFRRQGIGIYLERSSAVIIGNTIVENGADDRPRAGIHCGPGATPLIERNIIAFGLGPAIFCEPGADPTVGCNDLFANRGGDDFCGHGEGGNVSVDPGFCDRERGELTLRADSPCAQATGCGQVGAEPAACAASAVEPASWGQIKARFSE
jgi:hypothetical protein